MKKYVGEVAMVESQNGHCENETIHLVSSSSGESSSNNNANHGFVCLRNSGISKTTISRARNILAAFAALS